MFPQLQSLEISQIKDPVVLNLPSYLGDVRQENTGFSGNRFAYLSLDCAWTTSVFLRGGLEMFLLFCLATRNSKEVAS